MILLNWNHATCHQIWPRQGFVNWNNCILAFFCAGVMAWSSSTSPNPGAAVTSSSFLTSAPSVFTASSCGPSSLIASLSFGLGAGLVGFEGGRGMGLAAGGLLPLAEDDEIDAIDPIGAVAMGPIDRGGGRPGGGAASVDLPRWNLMLASGHTSLHRFRALSRLCSKSSLVQATPVKSSWRFWVRVRMFLSNTEPWQGPTSRWMSQLRQLNQLKTLQDYCHWINWGNSIGTNVDG